MGWIIPVALLAMLAIVRMGRVESDGDNLKRRGDEEDERNIRNHMRYHNCSYDEAARAYWAYMDAPDE